MATPLILQSRVLSLNPKFISNGRNPKPTKPFFLFPHSSASHSSLIAFSKKKKSALDAFMEEEEEHENFKKVSKNKQKFIEIPKKDKKFNPLDAFMEEEDQEDFIQVSKHKQKIKKVKKELKEENEEEFEEEEFEMGEGLEAFFSKLERDINNYDPSKEGVEFNEDIKEEDLINLEKELAQEFGEEGNSEFGDDLIQLPELKTWQMRKLAYALKIGKRKASIKKLSEDLCLERSTVLQFLKNPPPNLLLLSDSLPHEPGPHEPGPPWTNESVSVDQVHRRKEKKERESGKEDLVREKKKSGEKRMKKVQIETLEKVYDRMKRPTDEMVDSIIHVTNLPRKKVLKWFEERRVQDGVPHQPLTRSVFKPSRRKTHTVDTR